MIDTALGVRYRNFVLQPPKDKNRQLAGFEKRPTDCTRRQPLTCAASSDYERADHSSGRESQRLQLQVGEPLSRLPKARVEGPTTEHQVTVVLPFTEAVPGDTLTLQWMGSQSRTSVPTTLTPQTAGVEVHVPVSVSDLKEGEIVKVFYSLTRNGEPTRYSELLVWIMGQ